MPEPSEILAIALRRAESSIGTAVVRVAEIAEMVAFVCRNLQNRAGTRLLLSCLLAKAHRPEVDVRKPYTEIGGGDCFSGRNYDETYVSDFIHDNQLPCNPTTAFLTPALRNRNAPLVRGLDLVGRPPELYEATLELLDDVFQHRVSAEDLLAEVVRCLLIIRDERRDRIRTLLSDLTSTSRGQVLSSEDVVKLVEQHLHCPNSSRLPVFIVAAAYRAASDNLGERCLPLRCHTAADVQTGALGDLEITLVDDDDVVTAYEMKTRYVTKQDIDGAVQKIMDTQTAVDNYIFVTTDVIDETVQEYAKSIYESSGGIEFVILDCISFLRYFLHLFHRLRTHFINEYQMLVLEEPESAVSHELKEAFLALRQAAESAYA